MASAVLFLARPAAPAPAFSHRVHLAQRIECRTCHAAASSSQAAADNLLPSPQVCSGCHTEERRLPVEPVIRKPRPGQVNAFNHALHAKFGNIGPLILRAVEAKTYLSNPAGLKDHLASNQNACAACHRGLERSDEVTTAAFPQMADCLVCHTNIDPPFSCTKCHAKTMALKPANHTPDWLDRHTSGKAITERTSCAVCHGRRFTCLGCH